MLVHAELGKLYNAKKRTFVLKMLDAEMTTSGCASCTANLDGSLCSKLSDMCMEDLRLYYTEIKERTLDEINKQLREESNG